MRAHPISETRPQQLLITEVVMNILNAFQHSVRRFAVALTALTALAFGTTAGAAQQSFASPEAAVDALVAAVTSGNRNDLLKLLGPEGEKIISSGDATEDKNNRDKFVAKYQQAHKILSDGDARAMLYIGDDEWPFLIPVVKRGESWRFDTKAGEKDLLDVRIGKNELSTIQVVLAYVDAQREYYLADPDGDSVLAYATRFQSSPGKRDGLYWPAKVGEPESPMGPLFAAAAAEGYTLGKGKASPYHGYYYKILKGQGKNAPGGAYDYMALGHMIGGFALIAYPARYGVSGVKSFLVNHDGIVYETDLGPNTASIARKMKLFNPDGTAEEVDSSSLVLLPPLMEADE